MSEMQAPLDRLETRIENQAARIDALYRLLELHGILPRAVDAGRGDALFDHESEALGLSCGWDARRRPAGRPATRLRVGDATGV
jgi:hypothetical protein